MTYAYNTHGAPAVGGGLPGLPVRGSGIAEEYEQTHILVEGDTFDTYNTREVTVPEGVYLISSMTVVGGGGAGSSTSSTATQYAGNGGNLRWMQDVSVAPGDVVTLVAAGGRSPAANSANRVGLASEIRVNGIVVLRSSPALSDAVRGANGGLGGASNSGATPYRGAGGGGAGGYFLGGANGQSGGGGGTQGEGAGGGGALIIGLNKPGASMPTTTRSSAGATAPPSTDPVISIPGGKGAALDLTSPFKSDFTIIAGGKNGLQGGVQSGFVRGHGGAYGGGGGGPGGGNGPGCGGMGAASVTFIRKVE